MFVQNDPFGIFEQSPPATDLFRGLEKGGVLSANGIVPGAQAFLAAAIRQRFPNRTIVFVAEGLKAQEGIHQDLQYQGNTYLSAFPPCAINPIGPNQALEQGEKTRQAPRSRAPRGLSDEHRKQID